MAIDSIVLGINSLTQRFFQELDTFFVYFTGCGPQRIEKIRLLFPTATKISSGKEGETKREEMFGEKYKIFEQVEKYQTFLNRKFISPDVFIETTQSQ